MTRCLVLMTILAATLAAGCTPLPGRFVSAPTLRADEEQTLYEAQFTHGAKILRGFDAPAESPLWRVGDRVLFGVRNDRTGGQEIHFVLVTLKTPPLRPGTRVVIMPYGSDTAPTTSHGGTGPVFVTHDRGVVLDERVLIAETWEHSYAIEPAGGRARTFPQSSRAMLVAIDIFNDLAEHQQTSFVLVPEAFLRRGFYDYAGGLWAAREARPPSGASDSIPRDMDGVELVRWVNLNSTVMGLRDALGSADCLRGPFGWLFGRAAGSFGMGGAASEFEPGELEIGPVKRWPLKTDAIRGTLYLPLHFRAVGGRALRCDLYVVKPRPPLALTGGVIGVDVAVSSPADRRIYTRVLAAERGRASRKQLQRH